MTNPYHKLKNTLKQGSPKLFSSLKDIKNKSEFYFNARSPKVLKNEIGAVKKVLNSSKWNMNYGSDLVHEKLEDEFARYVGSKYAVAVNTGGMALQISLRALGLKYGDEVIHQVDTCVADSFGIMNAGCTPIFSDISEESFMLSESSLEKWTGKNTKAIVPIHMWGNPENMDMVVEFAKKHNLVMIEDAALALGTRYKSKMAGTFGKVGIFSFGCLKPIQAGEGGMIVTDDEALAKEMRTIRSWGEMTREYGVRDHKVLSWNGRMSEMVAAIALEQLRGFPEKLEKMRENSHAFYGYLQDNPFISPLISEKNSGGSNFSQFVGRLNSSEIKMSKNDFMQQLESLGSPVWHANFEPINTLSFFKNDTWKDWIVRGDLDKVSRNYHHHFDISNKIYSDTGIGFMHHNFLSKKTVKKLVNNIDTVINNR